jgi:predicted acyltransferase
VNAEPTLASKTYTRFPAVDAMRGATVMAMVLVNNPGSWEHVHAPLRHADWDGCTPTDLIFPFFVFVVGVSLFLSSGRFEAGRGERPSASVWLKTLRRAAMLVMLGLLLNAFPAFDLAHLRVTGVLQRIGVCFALGFALVTLVPRTPRAALAAAALVAYAWLHWWRGETPTAAGNASYRFDLLLIPRDHLWSGGFRTDPEGILGTIPAVGTLLIGYETARFLFTPALETPARAARCVRVAAAGLALAGSAYFLATLVRVPLNKPLWSPTYVLFTAGLAAACLAGLVWGMDERRSWGERVWRWAVVFGMNAIVLFVGSGLLARVLGTVKIGDATLKAWIYARGFESWLVPINASLGFALANVVFWWVVCWLLYRKRWFLKV